MFTDYPYLRGRALWVISRYAPLIPKDLVTTFFNTTLESLTQNVIPVKVAALQAIHKFFSFFFSFLFFFKNFNSLFKVYVSI